MNEKFTRDEIAVLAYELWERRSRPFGSPEIDWYAAERELRARNSQEQFYLGLPPEPEEDPS
jgi:DUF2934 family protein